MAISFVLSAEGQKTDGTTITLSLPGLQQNDIVVVIEGEGSTSGPRGISTAGYNNLGVDTDNSTVSFGAYYKVMGVSPDASVVVNAGANTVGHSAVAHVLRGQDTSTPIDVAATVTTGNTGSPNSPSINIVTSGAWVISAAAKDVSDTSVIAPTSPVTFANQIDINSDTTSDVTVGAATGIPAATGAFDPGGWASWTGGTNWIAVTIAIRPAAVATNWQGEARFAGSGSLSAHATVRTGHQGEARFAGAGSLTVQAQTVTPGLHAGEMQFAGTGSLSALARAIQAGRASLSGAGLLSAEVTGGTSGETPTLPVELARYENVEFDDSGNVFVNPTVFVTNEDGDLATVLYEDRAGDVPLANPFTVSGNDEFTFVLLHFDGGDGSTAIIDENFNRRRTWNSDHGAIATDQFQFGEASCFFGGEFFSDDRVYTNDVDDLALGTQDFAIDFRFRANASGEQALCGQAASSLANTNTAWYITRTSGNVIEAAVVQGTTVTAVTGSTQYTNATNTGWHHVAFVRSGNILRLFIDGVQQGGDVAFSGAVNTSTRPLAVGAAGDFATFWFGWIDEFRLSIGTDRGWTTNFTPPARAYGDVLYGFHAPGGAYRIDVDDGVNDHTRRYVGIGTANERDLDSIPQEPDSEFEIGMVRLATEIVDPGVSLSIEFSNDFSSAYDMFEFRLNGLVPEFIGSPLNLRLSTGNSPGFMDGADAYEWQKLEGQQFALSATADPDDNEIALLSALPTAGCTGWVRIVNPNSAVSYALVSWQIATHNSSATFNSIGSGRLRTVAPITGVQFYIATLNVAFDAGSITLFGYRK